MSKDRDPKASGVNRRTFLKTGAAAAAGVAAVTGKAKADDRGGFGARFSRVVRVYDPQVTDWDYSSNYYWDYIDQDRLNHMVDEGIKELAHVFPGYNHLKRAWMRIMNPYQAGDKIAVKINLNNYAGMSNEMDAIGPPIAALCRGLVDVLGVPAGDIYVYDCSRPIDQARVRTYVPYAVNWVESGDTLAQADYDAPVTYRGISTQYMPKVVTQAQHLINMPLFKDHMFCLSTMAFKNHLGTTKPGPSSLHSPIHTNLSDLNATPHIRDKTRLLFGDALFGLYNGGPYGEPMQWSTFPGGPTPNSIFLSKDPVAHESVMIDYLIAEQEHHGISVISHEFLHDASQYHELGVHEHRGPGGKYNRILYRQINAGDTFQ